MNLTTLRALAAVALHQTARTLHDVVRALRPTGVCIPADADVTVTTSPWFYTKSHNLGRHDWRINIFACSQPLGSNKILLDVHPARNNLTPCQPDLQHAKHAQHRYHDP